VVSYTADTTHHATSTRPDLQCCCQQQWNSLGTASYQHSEMALPVHILVIGNPEAPELQALESKLPERAVLLGIGKNDPTPLSTRRVARTAPLLSFLHVEMLRAVICNSEFCPMSLGWLPKGRQAFVA